MKLAGLETGKIDLKREDNRSLSQEDTLESAVLISLFSDARARKDDVLPDNLNGKHPMTLDRRGWCGDALSDDEHRIGSRLWLLEREKQTEETRQRAIEYCTEALQWMIDDKHVDKVDVNAQWHGIGRLDVLIVLFIKGQEHQIYYRDILGRVHAV